MKKLMMALMLMPMMALATTWYVNGSAGSDSNSGKSQSAAKKTIQAAINSSSAGDTILVAPGTYAPITTDNKAITIRGTAGASSTIIDAKGTSRRCVTARYEDFDGRRDVCVSTVIIGFTLQNGEANLSLDYYGEGGGCASGGTYKNCILMNGIGAGGGNAGDAVLENCLIKGGTAYNGGNVTGCIVRNCTIVDGEALHSGSAYYQCAVYNSICLGTSLMLGSWDWSALVDTVNGAQKNIFTDDPGFVDAANGDYRLAAGSPCIDAGNNSYVTRDKDLAGNARIVGGRVDIGCYEYGKGGYVRLTVKSNSSNGGSVNGGGKYVVSATATLKAKAKKGYAFAGWFKDKSCKSALNPKGYDNRNPTVKYTVPAGDTTVYAKFISKKTAKKSLKFSSATKKLAKTPKKVQSGNTISLSLGISSATITKVTAKGLPKGLSIDKTTGKISGTPTKAGTYAVKVTVKDAAGNKITQKVKIKVVAPKMPSKIVGTYYGYTGSWDSKHKKVQMDGHSREVTLTVSSSGKVSAKVGSSSFSGARLSLSLDKYYFYGECKATGETLSVWIDPTASWKDDSLTGYLWTSSGKKKDVRARKNMAETSAKAKKIAANCAKIGTQPMAVEDYGDKDYHSDYNLVCPACMDSDYFLGFEKVYVKAGTDGKAILSGSIEGRMVSGTACLEYNFETYYGEALARFFSGDFIIEIKYGFDSYHGINKPIDGATGGRVWKKK